MLFPFDSEKARGVSRWGWRAKGSDGGTATSPGRVSDVNLKPGFSPQGPIRCFTCRFKHARRPEGPFELGGISFPPSTLTMLSPRTPTRFRMKPIPTSFGRAYVPSTTPNFLTFRSDIILTGTNHVWSAVKWTRGQYSAVTVEESGRGVNIVL